VLAAGRSAAPILLRTRVLPAAFALVSNAARVSTSTPESTTANNLDTDQVRVEKGDQRVPGKATWPDKIVPGTPTPIVPGRSTTNAGRSVTTRVVCVPLLRALVPAGDGNFCTVTYGPGARVVVTANGPYPLAVTVTVTAPATRGYRAYRDVREYIVRG
jgi:hypothetical protein